MENSPFSSLRVAMTIVGMHYTDPQRDGQAELAWLATKVVYPRTTTHSSTNPP